jgi:hypothetical protein
VCLFEITPESNFVLLDSGQMLPQPGFSTAVYEVRSVS